MKILNYLGLFALWFIWIYSGLSVGIMVQMRITAAKLGKNVNNNLEIYLLVFAASFALLIIKYLA